MCMCVLTTLAVLHARAQNTRNLGRTGTRYVSGQRTSSIQTEIPSYCQDRVTTESSVGVATTCNTGLEWEWIGGGGDGKKIISLD